MTNKYLLLCFATFGITLDFWLEVDGHDAVFWLINSIINQILDQRAGATVQGGLLGSLKLAPGRCVFDHV